ncbi:hypothetical protein [Paraburkholderia caballeronis]|uniref:hypothetical protein n=1 Tax=Paraburkholderia caballeronis TaxID=416943 RepID=UPI00106660BD|nr:hypothetical protein [Paraburkholderia caballeronis]
MTVHHFVLSGLTSFVDEFSRGFTGISFDTATHGEVIAVSLLRSDGSGVKIRVRMHDLDGRVECGVLEFSEIKSEISKKTVAALSGDFGAGISVKRLEVDVDGITFESGIEVSGKDGVKFIIVSGAYPYTLAIDGLGLGLPFNPEYPLDEYRAIAV